MSATHSLYSISTLFLPVLSSSSLVLLLIDCLSPLALSPVREQVCILNPFFSFLLSVIHFEPIDHILFSLDREVSLINRIKYFFDKNTDAFCSMFNPSFLYIRLGFLSHSFAHTHSCPVFSSPSRFLR